MTFRQKNNGQLLSSCRTTKANPSLVRALNHIASALEIQTNVALKRGGGKKWMSRNPRPRNTVSLTCTYICSACLYTHANTLHHVGRFIRRFQFHLHRYWTRTHTQPRPSGIHLHLLCLRAALRFNSVLLHKSPLRLQTLLTCALPVQERQHNHNHWQRRELSIISLQIKGGNDLWLLKTVEVLPDLWFTQVTQQYDLYEVDG